MNTSWLYHRSCKQNRRHICVNRPQDVLTNYSADRFDKETDTKTLYLSSSSSRSNIVVKEGTVCLTSVYHCLKVLLLEFTCVYISVFFLAGVWCVFLALDDEDCPLVA